MSQNNEIEAKTLLPKTIYQKICADFPVKANFNQANYYFDTQDELLKKQQISCRIRIFADHAEQTLKIPGSLTASHTFHEAIEINDELTHIKAQSLVQQAQNQHSLIFNGSVGKYLQKKFPNNCNLWLQTFSKTHRILLIGPKDCELTLDATKYPDLYEDYELEIENSNPDLINTILTKLERNYSFTQNSTNTNQAKIGRALLHKN
ncbi:CYTH domain-containing protein [Lactobacillus sp. ESL0684]|uniref:CYTH domain-containing protein n=1 Tax=Lactobacillus sp. ESL0684 TaxID=2983213 RepID=UPI0023F75077|nr:CYTH domain-containing protein [Lactobacillus sp. ESL0684]WEV43140.1 CYTH domain-containing protein [Lactobacillus sp. ESL0684]